MRFAKISILVLVFFITISETAHARWRLFGRRGGRSGGSNVGCEWTGPVGILESDQAECQQKADYMARHGIFSHNAGGLRIIGRFEGIGNGGRGCATCRPGWSATLTGDASSVSSSGTVYRVRSWR